MIEDLSKFLELAGIDIIEVMPDKARPVRINMAGTVSIVTLIKRLGETRNYDYPHILKIMSKEKDFSDLILEYAKEKDLIKKKIIKTSAEEIEKLSNLVLYKDISFTLDKEPQFIVGTKDGKRSSYPAHHFISTFEVAEPELEAIPVVLEYSPRDKLGLYIKKTDTGEKIEHMNSYIPPEWMEYEEETPDELPELFKKLIWHVFPTEEAREFFFHWTYKSLTSRAETYLILQGAGAVGKNRVKIHLRALHGNLNSSDGKKSTLTTNFNSQLAQNTLIYFDELKFTLDEENVMKEIPNGTISIEEKHKNQTRSTRIFCSMVIANNKERDNSLPFDARKFSPIELNTRPLLNSMTDKEIEEMSAKVEFSDKSEYDLKYIAQIGRWILKHGKSKKWPTCEYLGPRFWVLCHSSMSMWQKRLIEFIFNHPPTSDGVFDGDYFTYSLVQEEYDKIISKRKRNNNTPQADFTTAQHFFEVFRDLRGDKIFEVKRIPRNPLGDFKVKILKPPYMGDDEEVIKKYKPISKGEDLL